MTSRQKRWIWAGTLVAALTAGVGPGAAQSGTPAEPHLPLDELPAVLRDRLRVVLDKPTLTARGPEEIFHCHLPTYHWLLEHPDQASRLWRLLNVGCADIRTADGGAFAWQDGKGGKVRWETVVKSQAFHVWLAEGQVKPGVLLPTAAFRAVLVVHHAEVLDAHGEAALRQRMTLFLHTDGQATALATRIVGASAPRMAEQYVGQVQTFFGGLAAYLFQHPEHARALAAQLQRPPTTDAPIPPPPSVREVSRGSP